VRTEDDLRTALTALERHAPDAARVLPGSKRHRSQLTSPRTVRWLAATAAAAALAGTVTALTVSGAPTSSSPNGGVASGSAGEAALRPKLLAAFSAASGDIVYVSGPTQNTGKSPIVTQFWTYPSQASPGQLVHTRSLTFNLSGTLDYSDEAIFVLTEQGATSPRPAPTTGERIIIDYAGKTWSDDKDTLLPESSDPSSSALIAHDIKTEHWTVRRTTLNGRAALELSFKETGDGNSSVNRLWIDAATYLPLRQTDTFGPPGMITSDTLNYEYLPATAANLAKLTAPIPAGFKRVSNNVSGATEIPVRPAPAQPTTSLRPSPR
jgi:hypothetical protein